MILTKIRIDFSYYVLMTWWLFYAYFQKKIDSIRFAGYTSYNCYVDFGQLNWGNLNGLIELDVLLTGMFVVDLKEMDIYPKIS